MNHPGDDIVVGTLTFDELDAIECGEALASPGPWTHETMHLDCRDVVDVFSYHPEGEQGRGKMSRNCHTIGMCKLPQSNRSDC
jgi:hypothetical protein